MKIENLLVGNIELLTEDDVVIITEGFLGIEGDDCIFVMAGANIYPEYADLSQEVKEVFDEADKRDCTWILFAGV